MMLKENITPYWTKNFFSCAGLFLLGIFVSTSASAADIKGYVNTGIWYLKNNVSSDSNFIADDGYGQSYVQNDFMMFNANLDFDAMHLNNPNASVQVGIHLKGRFLYDILDNPYSLAPPDLYRYQLDEANTELDSDFADYWIGRHTIYETGGNGVDGLTAIFHIKKHFGLGVYGGLGNDPRTLTGYIGPTYKTDLFAANFYTGGVFGKWYYERFQMDLGINAFYFKHSVDRSDFFAQFYWVASNVWALSGYLDAGFRGDTGIQKSLFMATTKITPKVTNRFSFSEFRSLVYSASDISAIPPPSTINPGFNIGTEVSTSEYYILRDEIDYRFNRNYIFTGAELGRRTYDDQNRAKYFVGYFDPALLESEFDFRVETDIIDNYESFNSSIDILLGRNFADEKFRAEAGGTFYANERDQFANGVFVTTAGEIEKETTARFNMIWNTQYNLSWFLNYAFYNETDVVNQNQSVHTHEVYLSANLRF